MDRVRNYSGNNPAVLEMDSFDGGPYVVEDSILDSNTDAPNGTNRTACRNDYCVTDDEYVDMISDFIMPKNAEWILISLYILVFIVGLCGNFLVCFAVWRNHHMRTVTNYFIVNLAVADFLVILVCLPPTVLVDTTETWYFGRVMCKLVHYMQGVSVSVSVLTLSFISIERWYAICHPLKFKATTSRARVMIVAIWVIALGLLVPELVVLGTASPYPDITIMLTVCKPTWHSTSQMVYELFKMVALYFLPFILMGFTYGQIIICLWGNSIPTEPTTYYSKSPKSVKSNQHGVEHPRSTAEQQLISRRKAAKMLIAVVVMFGVCYLPVHLLNILRYAKVLPESENIIFFPLVAHWVCYFNSAINPVIYNFMSARFRKEFKYACSCACCRALICCCDSWTSRRRHADSMYSYRYTNDMSQTEQITLTTINTHKYPPTHL